MAPEPGAIRTIGCNLANLVPDATVLADIQTAVDRAQSATIQACCLLLNLHIRRCPDANPPLDFIFGGNWIVEAFYEVADGDGTPYPFPGALLERVTTKRSNQLTEV